jgi:hypothetical protein
MELGRDTQWVGSRILKEEAKYEMDMAVRMERPRPER